MPELKPISGHGSVKRLIHYLQRVDPRTGESRALERGYINCSERDAAGRPTWTQMDSTRAAFGNDVTSRGGKPARTFEHFVLSPDPTDSPTAAEVRDFAMEWAGRHFGSHEVAVYIHDDNASRIMHAHVVVNNTDLETGRRLAPKLTPSFERSIWKDVETMARERGWRNFLPPSQVQEGEPPAHRLRPLEKDDRGLWHEAMERDTGEKRRSARTSRDVAVRGIDEGGRWSWVEDVRGRIAIARALSRTEGEFLRECGALGLSVSENASHDYTYTHPSAATRRVTGRHLGSDWTRAAIGRRMAYDSARRWPIPDPATRRAVEGAVSAMGAEGVGVSMVGVTRADAAVSARDVAEMLEVQAREDIRSLEDYRDARGQGTDGASLRRAEGVARAINAVPAGRPRSAGRRIPYAERLAMERERARDDGTTGGPSQTNGGGGMSAEEHGRSDRGAER